MLRLSLPLPPPYRPHQPRCGEARRRAYRGARRGRRNAQYGFCRLYQRHPEPCARRPQDADVLGNYAAEAAKIAKKYMHNPEEIVIGTRNEGAKNVRHIYYMVNARDKYLALKRIADNNPNIYAIIFCRTRRDTQEVADKLIADGYNADALHGDLSQQQRDLTMKKFRDHVTSLLVATDVAARGLDVDNLTHVINYGLPDDTAVYTHRSGRTGRAGKAGVSVAIIHSREKGRLREIERIIGKSLSARKSPRPNIS